MKIEVPSPGDWANKIYCQSSEKMNQLPNNSVGLAFTSPPYNVGKEYDDNLEFEEYLNLIKNVAKKVYRTLRPGVVMSSISLIGVGNHIFHLHSFFYNIHTENGF